MNAVIRHFLVSARRRVVLAYGLLALSVIVILFGYTTGYMTIASVAYALMVLGVVQRNNRSLHVPLVSAAMVTDVGLVLILELSRAAIKTTISFKLNGYQQAHIYFSLLAVLFYFPVYRYGRMRLRGTANASESRIHLRLALLAFCFRTLGFVFMFSMLTKKG